MTAANLGNPALLGWILQHQMTVLQEYLSSLAVVSWVYNALSFKSTVFCKSIPST